MPPLPPARLIVVGGPREGERFALSSERFAIGRQAGNALQVLDALVSRRHCEIVDSGGRHRLHDLESALGSFVNAVPVRQHPLAHGDLIQIGHTTLLYAIDHASEAVPAAGDSFVAGSTIERRPEEIADLLAHPSWPGAGPETGRLLLELATAVQDLRDARDLAVRVLDLLVRALRASRGTVLLTPARGGAPEVVACRGGDDIVVGATVLERVAGDGVALLWDELSALPDAPSAPEGGDAASLIAAPLTGRREIHGLVYLESAMAGAFGEAELERLAAAAGITGLALDSARAFAGLMAENRRLRSTVSAHGMVGESAAMKRLLDFVARVGPVDSTVLLRGESGTGKELAAHALHAASPRADGPFIAVNCATLSETLLESELFGHERGAFTGAVARKAGRLEAADGGTLFLDEVGEIPAALQARLLRALEERQFERVGGTRSIEVDVRIVAATNRDLEKALRDGTFRQDLFYRLNVITHTLPALRRRREDIPLLARHFARHHGTRLGRLAAAFDARALRILSAYGWPGNIRQLSNAIERALVLGDGIEIRPEDLPDELLDAGAGDVSPSDFQSAIIETKKRLLTTALNEAEGNAAAAARRLGLHPNSFRRLMRQLGLRASSSSGT